MTNELIALGRYLAGEFDNREQAIANPAWYVHLRLWQRPVPLFRDDSITLYAEQANVLYLDKPYRPRLLRLQQKNSTPTAIEVQYYMFKDISWVRGAGSSPEILKQLTLDEIEFLPGCTLTVASEKLSGDRYCFKAFPDPDSRCCFSYSGNTYQVSLGFEVTPDELKVYDRGIDPKTGKGIWGALLGPFHFNKRQDFSREV